MGHASIDKIPLRTAIQIDRHFRPPIQIFPQTSDTHKTCLRLTIVFKADFIVGNLVVSE